MVDDNIKLGIELDVHSTGEDLIDRLNSKLKTMESRLKSITAGMRSAASGAPTTGRGSNTGTDAKAETKAKQTGLAFDRASVAEFKRKMTLQARMASQHAKQDSESLKAYRDRVAFQSRATAKAERDEARAVQARMRDEAQAFRQRFSFGTRMGRQGVQEERAGAREQERSIASAARAESQRMRDRAADLRQVHRQELQATRAHEKEISRHESQRRRGYADMRSGGGDVRQGMSRATMGAGVVTAATTAAAGSAARKGISTRLEVDTAETNLKIFSGQTNEQIKAARKGFLDNEAIRNGLGIKGGLDAYSEVLKTGMASPAENTKTIMRAVSALELDFKDTTKLAGLIDRNYGASSTPAKIKSALNAIAVAAREDPTQSNEIVEGVKRSFGALSTGNITPEQLTAMVSGGQSVGIQPGKAGTFVATMAKQLSMGSSKFLGKKNRLELDFAAKELGFVNSRSLAQNYSKDSYGTMMSVHENLAKMEAAKRTQVSEALYGRQWSDEGLQMAQGVGGVRKTFGEISDGKNSNFLDEAARQRSESLQGQWNSTKSIFNKFWDAFGSGFEDILTSINKYFLDLNSSFDYDKIKSYVVSFFDGVKDALGVKTWTELLQNTFGGNLGNYGSQIREFARGFTEGVLSIVRTIRAVFNTFAGSNASAEQIGNWTGKFLAFAAACIVSAPAIAVLTGLATAIAGLATVALASWRILRAAGLVGATGLGSTPKAPTATPGSGAVGRLGGLGAAGAAAGFAGSSSLTKGEQDAITSRLGKWAQDREKLSAPSKPWVDVPPKAVEELKEAIEENSKVHLQSFEVETGFKGLIHKASITATAPAEAVRSTLMGGSGSAMGGARSVMSGSVGSGGPLSNSTPGSALGSTGLGGRGIIGGRSAVPGAGMGGGSASSNPANSAASAAMLDAIAGTESGKASYNAVLGNGKYGTPSKPVSQMSLDEAFAFGRQIKSRHGSSSALGRYQIVGNTMRAAQKALGIDGSAPFNAENQDRMARWIARSQGLGAWEGLKSNPRAMATARAAMAQGGANDSPGRSNPAVAALGTGVSGGVHPLDGRGRITSEFGNRIHPITGRLKHHNGIDLAAPAGTAVKAMKDGVVSVDRSGDATIKHPDGTSTTYRHITASIQQGAKVAAGQVIGGLRANDPRSTGPHLHLESRDASGALVNPRGLLAPGAALAQQESLKSSGWRKAGESAVGSSEELKSSGWNKGLGGNMPLGDGVPLKGSNLQSASSGMGRSGGGSVGGSPISITMHHQGSDPQAIANAVQRRLQDSMNRRSHDLDPSSISGIG